MERSHDDRATMRPLVECTPGNFRNFLEEACPALIQRPLLILDDFGEQERDHKGCLLGACAVYT